MPKSPRKPSPKSPNSNSRTTPAVRNAKRKTPRLQGKAAKLANLAKAPSHQPKRKRAPQTKPTYPQTPGPPPATTAPAHPLENWISIPLAHRRRHERMTHIDAWLQHVWRKDDGTMELKNAKHFAAELRVTVDTIYADLKDMETTWRLP